MKQLFLKKGVVTVDKIPAPIINENEILVQVSYSCISAGTEIAGIRESGMPIYRKALKQRQNINKVLELIRSEGIAKSVAMVRDKINMIQPIGYSASGLVLETGGEIDDIYPMDRVACAGAGIANHAGFIAVPRNLLVKVPDSLSLEQASTVTIGSIALQGIRRADPKLGEYVVVTGLGILGQLSVQMLKANGNKVIGIDVDQRRVDMALSLGLDKGLNPAKDDVISEVIKFSDGYGADSVIITASTKSDDIINQAMEMCRKKGKVVIVGAVGLKLQREEFYKKELDLLISTSYGPGRYDKSYEIDGQDYPYAYVRWTEERNMEEYLRLVDSGKINIQPLIEQIYHIEMAPKAYTDSQNSDQKPLLVLLEYNKEPSPARKVIISRKKISRDKINVALIGAGGFARVMHLPNMSKMQEHYNIHAIVDISGSSAKVTAEKYGARYATTDYREVIQDKDVDMVIIATPHNLHSSIAVEAAKMGKPVFVEKPMALNKEELQGLVTTLEKTKVPFLVGFNRRFSPYSKKIKEIIDNRSGPMIINYRMNAGFIPKENWVHSKVGGGRNIGEACHIYDLFTFFTGAEVEAIKAFSIDPKTNRNLKNDNFVAVIKFNDGSVCNLIYTALGSPEYPKEEMDLYVDGMIIRLSDYKELSIFGTRDNGLKTRKQNKGHMEELRDFAMSINEGNGYPIPLWQLIQATEISFEVERLI